MDFFKVFISERRSLSLSSMLRLAGVFTNERQWFMSHTRLNLFYSIFETLRFRCGLYNIMKEKVIRNHPLANFSGSGENTINSGFSQHLVGFWRQQIQYVSCIAYDITQFCVYMQLIQRIKPCQMVTFFFSFFRLCSPRLHSFNQKQSYIVKYDYNSK